MQFEVSCRQVLSVIALALFSTLSPHAFATPTATTTTLTVMSGGSAVASGGSITSGAALTLTASVIAGSTNVIAGQVNFCDATAAHCTDIHILGTAQLTAAGTATVRLTPSIGSHSYKAVFAGTPSGGPAYSGSSSAASSLTVTGTWPSVTGIAQSGGAGNYTLTATVGSNALAAPTGGISFLNASASNAVLGTASLGAGTAGLAFLPAETGLGTLPSPAYNATAVTVADFNGDGIPDVAITDAAACTAGNCWDSEVTVLLGDGKGNFGTPVQLDLGTIGVSSVQSGDFNGDGITDLAIGGSTGSAGSSTPGMTILLGNGDGSFTMKGTVAVSGNFQNFVAGDFNGDGIQDLAILNTTANVVTLLLGNGDGTFTASTAALASAGTSPAAIATGDFNGDGNLDLAIVNSSATTATILLGNGDGTFTAAASPQTGNNPTSIVVGDFNGDGKLDLAILNEQDSTVTVLTGSGTGTFTPASGSPIALAANSGATAIALGDFNGDHRADLFVGNAGQSGGTVTAVLLGNGDGTFKTPVTGPASSLFASSLGDFNGDGRTDFVVAPPAGPAPGAVYLSINETSTASATSIAVPVGTSTQEAVAGYAGDTSNMASVSGATVLTAAQGTPTVTVASSVNPVPYKATTTLTATVAGSGIEPTGTVSFYDGSTLLGAGTLNSSGVATLASNALSPGSNSITASYGGDANYVATVSAALVVTMSGMGTATTTVTVTPSATSILAGQPLTVAVAVAKATGNHMPSGTVTLSSGTYSSKAGLTNGAASFTVPTGAFAIGTDTLTATYSGDGNYAVATGTSSVTVAALLMTIPAPAAIAAGSSATATATITAGSTYAGTLNLTCALTTSPSGAQNLPACSLNPTSVTLKASGTATSTLTVTTTAASTTSSAKPRAVALGFGTGTAALALVFLCGVSSGRRRLLSMLTLLLVVCCVAAVGCGGGSKTTTTTTNPGTTAGAYTFTVTGTDSTTATTTVMTTVSVTVQ